ncbi:MAG: sugar phosphate isomerase/epimerase family protein [Acidimicrobiales bacterium]
MSVELGIFARIFSRPTASEVAAAVAGAGFSVTQLNLSSMGLPTVPPEDLALDLRAIEAAFSAEGVRIWGLSATYNVIDPDLARRRRETTRAAALVAQAPELQAPVVTLCSGSRDPDNMWRRHPDNDSDGAWRDLRATLEVLLPAAASAGVQLGIEPEPGNVVADARRARRLLDELGEEARWIGIVLDPANLVTPETAGEQEQILHEAFSLLGEETVAVHAKDVVAGRGYAAAGVGMLDYGLIFELHAGLPHEVPVIIQDADEDDVARTRAFLLAAAIGAGAAR